MMPPRPQDGFAAAEEVAVARQMLEANLPERREGFAFTEAMYQLTRTVLSRHLPEAIGNPWRSPVLVACFELCEERGFRDVFDGIWIQVENKR